MKIPCVTYVTNQATVAFFRTGEKKKGTKDRSYLHKNITKYSFMGKCPLTNDYFSGTRTKLKDSSCSLVCHEKNVFFFFFLPLVNFGDKEIIMFGRLGLSTFHSAMVMGEV